MQISVCQKLTVFFASYPYDPCNATITKYQFSIFRIKFAWYSKNFALKVDSRIDDVRISSPLRRKSSAGIDL